MRSQPTKKKNVCNMLQRFKILISDLNNSQTLKLRYLAIIFVHKNQF